VACTSSTNHAALHRMFEASLHHIHLESIEYFKSQRLEGGHRSSILSSPLGYVIDLLLPNA